MNVLNRAVIALRERHPIIFMTFDAFEKGGAVVLINDHDRQPID